MELSHDDEATMTLTTLTCKKSRPLLLLLLPLLLLLLLLLLLPLLRNQIWDKYHFSGTQLWLRAHGSAEKNNNRAWCARCMDHFERYWNICAKPACDRVHPVAVVTASSRISQNSRAGWPTVLHQRAPPV